MYDFLYYIFVLLLYLIWRWIQRNLYLNSAMLQCIHQKAKKLRRVSSNTQSKNREHLVHCCFRCRNVIPCFHTCLCVSEFCTFVSWSRFLLGKNKITAQNINREYYASRVQYLQTHQICKLSGWKAWQKTAAVTRVEHKQISTCKLDDSKLRWFSMGLFLFSVSLVCYCLWLMSSSKLTYRLLSCFIFLHTYATLGMACSKIHTQTYPAFNIYSSAGFFLSHPFYSIGSNNTVKKNFSMYWINFTAFTISDTGHKELIFSFSFFCICIRQNELTYYELTGIVCFHSSSVIYIFPFSVCVCYSTFAYLFCHVWVSEISFWF